MPRGNGRDLDLGIYARQARNKISTQTWFRDAFNKLLFQEIRDAIKPVAARRPRFNPYLYENLLSDG